jgi:electron transfer flavoprotein beta subunit
MAEVLGFDLILTGDRSQDTGNGQVGALLAGQLGLPCINSVISLELEWAKRSIIARKVLSRGYEESIRCGLPLVVTMGGYPFAEKDPSFRALLEALEKEILCWDLARLGISEESLRKKEQRLTFSPLRFPRPRVRAIPAPDSSLPAFYRILKLLEGSVQGRGGKLFRKNEDELVEELFQTLRREGWLDHLQKEG